jgi:hypothetical protein
MSEALLPGPMLYPMDIKRCLCKAQTCKIVSVQTRWTLKQFKLKHLKHTSRTAESNFILAEMFILCCLLAACPRSSADLLRVILHWLAPPASDSPLLWKPAVAPREGPLPGRRVAGLEGGIPLLVPAAARLGVAAGRDVLAWTAAARLGAGTGSDMLAFTGAAGWGRVLAQMSLP